MLPRGKAERLLASERVRRAGWLLKAYGGGPQLTWRRKWVRLHPAGLIPREVWRAGTPAAAGAGARARRLLAAQGVQDSVAADTAGSHVAQAAMMRDTVRSVL